LFEIKVKISTYWIVENLFPVTRIISFNGNNEKVNDLKVYFGTLHRQYICNENHIVFGKGQLRKSS